MEDRVLEAIREQKALVRDNLDKANGRLDDLDSRISEIEKAITPRKVSLPGVNEEKEKFSFARAFYAIASGDWSEAGFEREVFDNTRKQMSTVAGSGGWFVPSQYIAEIIEMLRAKAVVIEMGATVLDGLTASPVEIPRQSSASTAYWVGENVSITESMIGDERLSLTPKSVAALVKTSMRLVKLSSPAVETLIRNDIAKQIALAIDLAALRGSGTESTPRGIKNTTGVSTVAIGANGGDFTHAIAQNMITEVEASDALEGNPGFVFHSRIKNKLKKERIAQFSGDTGGAYVILPMTDQMLADSIGYKYGTSNQIPTNLVKGTSTDCSEVYFGNWADLIIGQWGGLELMASKEASTAFERNQLWIRAIQEVDIALRHPKSFCVCSDARV